MVHNIYPSLARNNHITAECRQLKHFALSLAVQGVHTSNIQQHKECQNTNSSLVKKKQTNKQKQKSQTRGANLSNTVPWYACTRTRTQAHTHTHTQATDTKQVESFYSKTNGVTDY